MRFLMYNFQIRYYNCTYSTSFNLGNKFTCRCASLALAVFFLFCVAFAFIYTYLLRFFQLFNLGLQVFILFVFR